MQFDRYLTELTRRPIPKEMAFPEEEYRRRLRKVRSYMSERALDALLVTDVPNIGYVSGFETFVPSSFGCLILTHDQDPTLQVAEFEIPGALLNGWVTDVRATRFNDPDAAHEELSSILRERHLDGRRIGVETRLPGLNIHSYQAMQAALPSASFVETSDLVFEARLVKSSAELDLMRRAAEMAKSAIAEAVRVVRAGLSENDVASVAYAVLAKSGSEYFSCQPCVMAGHRSGWIHTSQKRTRINSGDTVMMEMAAFVHRYTSAVMHTVVVCEPSPVVARLADASLETLNLIQGAVKPGRTADDVAREAKKGLDGVKDEAYSTGMFGYSVGLSFPPTWREGTFMIAEGVDRAFEPGMTFLSPITLRIPGTVGVGFSDTFVVTQTGCEPLTARDRALVVAPE